MERGRGQLNIDVGNYVKSLAPQINKFLYSMVFLCVEDVDDCAFLERQFMLQSAPFFAISALRDRKLSKQCYTFDEFKQDYLKCKVAALEKLFLHPMRSADLHALQLHAADGLSVEMLYKLHQLYPKKPLSRLLHKAKDFAKSEA